MNSNLHMSPSGLAVIIHEEGSIDGLYDDPSGYATFGVGHLVHHHGRWASFLLRAAKAMPAFAKYVETKKYGKKKSASTTYLARSVVSATDLSSLVDKANELGRNVVAERRYKKAYSALTVPERHTIDGIVDAAVREELRLLAPTPTQLLERDVGPTERTVRKLVTRTLAPAEFDALVSFVFNVGATNFANSTLLKKVNAGLYHTGTADARRHAIAEIEAEFAKWNKSGGKVLQGLVRRRAHEADEFLGPAREELKRLRQSTPAMPSVPSQTRQILGTGPSARVGAGRQG